MDDKHRPRAAGSISVVRVAAVALFVVTGSIVLLRRLKGDTKRHLDSKEDAEDVTIHKEEPVLPFPWEPAAAIDSSVQDLSMTEDNTNAHFHS